MDVPVTAYEVVRIRTLSGEALQTVGTHTVPISIQDDHGNRASVLQSVIAANMVGDDLVLGMPWSREQNPDIDWAQGILQLKTTLTPAGNTPKIELVGAAAFAGSARATPSLMGCVHVTQALAALSICGHLSATIDIDLPSQYAEFEDVFSKEAADELPLHGPQDHAIETGGRVPSFGPLYNLSATEL